MNFKLLTLICQNLLRLIYYLKSLTIFVHSKILNTNVLCRNNRIDSIILEFKDKHMVTFWTLPITKETLKAFM